MTTTTIDGLAPAPMPPATTTSTADQRRRRRDAAAENARKTPPPIEVDQHPSSASASSSLRAAVPALTRDDVDADAGYGRPPVVSARLVAAAMWCFLGAAVLNAVVT